MLRSEYHITVAGNTFDNALRWSAFCAQVGVKSLWIELSNFRRQLMCAAKTNIAPAAWNAGFEVTRIKHEVEPLRIDITTHGDLPDHKFLDTPVEGALYYECHVKLDGPFRPEFEMASRDLLRDGRWYCTMRQNAPFDYAGFVQEITVQAERRYSRFAGYEYESCVLDTNRDLDRGWR